MQAIADLLDEDAVALDVVDDAFSLPKSYAITKESGACLLPMATNGRRLSSLSDYFDV